MLILLYIIITWNYFDILHLGICTEFVENTPITYLINNQLEIPSIVREILKYIFKQVTFNL